LLSACQPEADTAPPQVRPVRTVTVVKREVGETVSYTGRIQAENETRLSFRISGRMVERSVNVGDHVEPGQVVAKLEPQDELNALRTAQASVAAAQGQLNQAQSNFDRQQTLLARDIASRAQFEQAESALKTARAQLDTAEAQLKAAKDRVSYTEFRVDSAGTVITTGAEAGEVGAGQWSLGGPRDGRDAGSTPPSRARGAERS
jgi:RND family efflux transporter MFP subunit